MSYMCFQEKISKSVSHILFQNQKKQMCLVERRGFHTVMAVMRSPSNIDVENVEKQERTIRGTSYRRDDM